MSLLREQKMKLQIIVFSPQMFCLCFCDNQMRNDQNRFFFKFYHNWLRYKKIKKKFKTKTILNVAIEQIHMSRIKFCRLQKQNFFLKKRKKKLFDKNLFVVEKLERLKKFEKINEIQQIVKIASFIDDFFIFDMFFFYFCFDSINLLSIKFSKKFLTIFKFFYKFSRVL